jgi:hypothetical protein
MVFKAMTEFVKEFIELYIDPIDEGDWSEVVEGWYEKSFYDFGYQDEEFTELCKVMSSIGVDFMRVTEKERVDFMKNLFSQLLKEEIESARWNNTKSIRKTDVLMRTVSNLGFTPEELEKILDEVAEDEYKLEVDFTCYDIR